MPLRLGEPPKFDSPLSLAPSDTILQHTLDQIVVGLNQPFRIRIIVQRHFLVVLVRDIGLQSPRSEDLFPWIFTRQVPAEMRLIASQGLCQTLSSLPCTGGLRTHTRPPA